MKTKDLQQRRERFEELRDRFGKASVSALVRDWYAEGASDGASAGDDENWGGDSEKAQKILELIRSGSISPVLQPKVALRQESAGEKEIRISGFELLCRLSHDGRDLFPGEFLPHLEASGREELDWAMLRTAMHLSKAAVLESTGARIGVNLNPSTLIAENFSEKLRSLIQEMEGNPNVLRLEILESERRTDRARMGAAMRECIGLGVDFALDDYCAGYSEPEDLWDFPVAEVKLDWAIASALTRSAERGRAKNGIAAIVEHATLQGASVTVEGIESSRQEQILERLGVKTAQGFLYFSPMPALEALALLPESRIVRALGRRRAALSPEDAVAPKCAAPGGSAP